MNISASRQAMIHTEDAAVSIPVSKRESWDKRAQYFSRHAAATGYAGAFIRIIQTFRSWTVLDMACGAGTIAVPIAKKVRSVTAVDPSKEILNVVEGRCRIGGITNVKTIQGCWDDDWDRLGIGIHDVAVASRSLVADNVKDSIAKLDRSARKAVYISMAVGSGPLDKQLFESTGRKLDTDRDYIYYYTILHEMGIMANVAFIPEYRRNNWKNHEEALEDHRWMFNGMTKNEEDKVRAYLKRNLVPVLKHWRLPYSRNCHWAVMWWIKKPEI